MQGCLSALLLWFLVVAAGMLTGGSIFERLVVTPLWAGTPPTSVTAWQHGMIQSRFFVWVTPAYALSSLTAVATSFALHGSARAWTQLAGGAGVLVIVWTALFFVPILRRTQASGGAGVEPAEISRLVRQFTKWGAWRTGLALAGWLCAIRALTLL